jgi:hypothetical protein
MSDIKAEVEMVYLMAEVEALLAAGGIEWEEGAYLSGRGTQIGELPADLNPRFFQGKKEGWHIVVCSFSIEDQGFPPGSRGHDGAARHKDRGVVLHLTRGQAEAFYADAEKVCGGGS